MQQISPTELKQRLDQEGPAPLLLDVREPIEYRYCHIDGSVSMPMEHIFLTQEDLDPEQETVIICHHGMRSSQVANFLISRGFKNVINLTGGVAAWAAEVDPSMPTY